MGWFSSFVHAVTDAVHAVVSVAVSVAQESAKTVVSVVHTVVEIEREIVAVAPTPFHKAIVSINDQLATVLEGTIVSSIGFSVYVLGVITGNEAAKDYGSRQFLVGLTMVVMAWSDLPPFLKAVLTIIMAIVSLFVPFVILVYLAISALIIVLVASAAGSYISASSLRNQMAFLDELYFYGVLPPDMVAQYLVARSRYGSTVSAFLIVDGVSDASSTVQQGDGSSLTEDLVLTASQMSDANQNLIKQYASGLFDSLKPPVVVVDPAPAETNDVSAVGLALAGVLAYSFFRSERLT
jgi:hypothetical protein